MKIEELDKRINNDEYTVILERSEYMNDVFVYKLGFNRIFILTVDGEWKEILDEDKYNIDTWYDYISVPSQF